MRMERTSNLTGSQIRRIGNVSPSTRSHLLAPSRHYLVERCRSVWASVGANPSLDYHSIAQLRLILRLLTGQKKAKLALMLIWNQSMRISNINRGILCRLPARVLLCRQRLVGRYRSGFACLEPFRSIEHPRWNRYYPGQHPTISARQCR